MNGSNGFPPYPPPGPFDPSGPWHNPGVTNPFPQPQNMPVPGWWTGPVPLSWAAGDGEPVFSTATWKSPIFDLRPEFRGVPHPNDGAQPIWISGGGCLHVHVYIPNSLGVTLLGGLNAVYYEDAHPDNPAEIIASRAVVTEEMDCTFAFNISTGGPKNMAELKFTPGPYAPRYWRVTLRLDFYVDQTDATGLRVTAGYY